MAIVAEWTVAVGDVDVEVEIEISRSRAQIPT